jgi:hypothetical protein
LKSFYFCDLGAHVKFQNPKTTPSGSKVMAGDRKKKKNRKKQKEGKNEK